MSHRRKHVTQKLSQLIQPPTNNQQIVKALGSKGDNLIEVELPDGASALVLLPARFNKKLWIRKGGYLIVEQSTGRESGEKSRISGTIEAVLFEDDVAALQQQGHWPPAFGETRGPVKEGLHAKVTAHHGGAKDEKGEGSESDDSLPPLEPNNNRPVIRYDVSDDDSEENISTRS